MARRYNPSRVKPEILRNFISTYLQTRKTHEESISYLIQHIRETGNMYIPMRLNDAESEFERMGFKLRRECNQYGSILRTYVTLEACARCNILIRPEGGHMCGTCGRDV